MSERAEPPIACTLQGAGYRERLAWIEELARDGLRAVTRDDLRLELRYTGRCRRPCSRDGRQGTGVLRLPEFRADRDRRGSAPHDHGPGTRPGGRRRALRAIRAVWCVPGQALKDGACCNGTRGHNQWVRKLVAAMTLVLFASLNAIDGVCCPDGCTDEPASTSQHHDPASSDGACVLCLGGVESAVPQSPSPSVILTDRIAPSLATHPLCAPTDPPDHPPRS